MNFCYADRFSGSTQLIIQRREVFIHRVHEDVQFHATLVAEVAGGRASQSSGFQRRACRSRAMAGRACQETATALARLKMHHGSPLLATNRSRCNSMGTAHFLDQCKAAVRKHRFARFLLPRCRPPFLVRPPAVFKNRYLQACCFKIAPCSLAGFWGACPTWIRPVSKHQACLCAAQLAAVSGAQRNDVWTFCFANAIPQRFDFSQNFPKSLPPDHCPLQPAPKFVDHFF